MNDVLNQIVEIVRREPGIALSVAAGAYLFLLALVLWLLVRYGRLARKQAHLLRGADGVNLEQMLMSHLSGTETMRRDLAHAAEQGSSNNSAIRLCLQKVGMVRYDAFPNIGGQQSFSAALLDDTGNGLVLSALFSRHDMRVYAKPLTSGTSALALTDEERQAIAAARTGGTEATAAATVTSGRSR